MASNNGLGNGMPHLPVFKGTNYHFWSLKMVTLFRSQELWSLVKDGFPDHGLEDADAALKEKRKKDAKALFILQQALDDSIFPRIAAAETSNAACEILKTEYLGDKKVIAARLQNLRGKFETALMGENESVSDYLSRVSSIAHQIRCYGDTIKDDVVVGKILRSLTKKYEHVVTSIEQSNELSTYKVDELMGVLQVYEERMGESEKEKDEKAFQARGESSKDKSGHSRIFYHFGSFEF